MYDLLLNALVGGVSGVALPSMLGYLFRKWIWVRLRESVAFEYKAKLQELQQSHTELLEQIREERTEREALRSAVIRSLAETQAGTLAHRLQAIESLWANVLMLYKATSPMIFTIDRVGYREESLGPEALEWLKQNDYLELLVPLHKISDEVARIRPFIGESLYRLFVILRMAHGRATSSTLISFEKGKLLSWSEDQEVQQHLAAALTDEELLKFQGISVGQLAWIRETLEEKIVLEVSRELSGQISAAENIKRTGEIYRTTRPILSDVA